VLSRLLEVPLLPWHLWPGRRRWHRRVGGGPRQRLATRRCHAASAARRGAGHRGRLRKAKQNSSAALLGRSHAAEVMGRRKMEQATAGLPPGGVFLATLRSRVLEEGGLPAARSGRAGGVVLCQHFSRTVHGWTAATPAQRHRSRGGRERRHRVSVLEVGSLCSLVEPRESPCTGCTKSRSWHLPWGTEGPCCRWQGGAGGWSWAVWDGARQPPRGSVSGDR